MQSVDRPEAGGISASDEAQAPSGDGSPKRWRWAVVGLLLVLGLGIGSGLWLGRQRAPEVTAPPAGTVVAADSGLALPPAVAVRGNQMVVYEREGCPHCAAAHEYLEALAKERPGLTVEYYDVVKDAAARQRLEALVKERGLTAVSVPVFVIGPAVIVGFSDAETSGPGLVAALDGAASGVQEDSFSSCGAGEVATGATAVTEVAAGATAVTEVDLPLLGNISASSMGLPLFTMMLGLVDGFNPCAMWVLLFILSMLVNLKDRRKMALVAGTFVVVSGVVYLSFMAAWLGVFQIIGFSRVLQLVLGLFALVVGFVNVKDYFAFKQGLSFSIPESRKPTIYRRSRDILKAESLLAALIGVAILAVMVNLVELLCTAGLPAVYTQVLAAQDLPRWENFLYLVMYILFYMIDDTIMVVIAVVTLSQTRLQEKGGRALKLVSGLVMLALAGLLLFRPEWLAALG